ncbi:MAG: hypothetical protein CVV23_09055 [Ignavibacteriae bacterium HGW-Ignavibacteriae-2]|nr:MAG: hypothetical protein CVV23_09055 [Ignavibacteriae bacterium HGW-Ignavibacteriae-2]
MWSFIISFSSKYNLSDKSIVSSIDDLSLWSAPFGLKLLDQIEYKNNITVLDIGSGFGFPSIEIASRLGDTCKVFGIDPWKEANQRASVKIKSWGLNNIKIIDAVAESIPFDNDQFELITSNNGLNNVENDEKTFSEIARVAKAGAQLVFTINLQETMIEFYNIYKSVLVKNNLNDEIEKLSEHIFKKRKPLKYTINLVEKNGFHIYKIIEDEFYLRYTDGTSMLNHFFIKLAFKESWFNILSPEISSSIYNELEYELNKVSRQTGSIKLKVPYVCINAVKIN